MNIYQARWNNALKVYGKLIALQQEGFWIFNEKGELQEPFEIKGNEIIQTLSETSSGLMFENNKDCDHGLYTTIKEHNAEFNGWTFVDPGAKQPLKF